MKLSKEAVVAYKEPKDIRDITEADRAKLPKDTKLLDLYLIRGIKDDTREKIVPFAPTPVVNDYCDVVHLIVEAPAGMQVIPQTPDNSAHYYYKWAGKPNPPEVLKYVVDNKEYDVDLSTNFDSKSKIPDFVRAEAKTAGVHLDMPVRVYDTDPYWWLTAALKIDQGSLGKVELNIEDNGVLSVDLYDEEKENQNIYNIRLSRDGRQYKIVDDPEEKPLVFRTTDEIASEANSIATEEYQLRADAKSKPITKNDEE